MRETDWIELGGVSCGGGNKDKGSIILMKWDNVILERRSLHQKLEGP